MPSSSTPQATCSPRSGPEPRAGGLHWQARQRAVIDVRGIRGMGRQALRMYHTELLRHHRQGGVDFPSVGARARRLMQKSPAGTSSYHQGESVAHSRHPARGPSAVLAEDVLGARNGRRGLDGDARRALAVLCNAPHADSVCIAVRNCNITVCAPCNTI
jgi:hypothetical protein